MFTILITLKKIESEEEEYSYWGGVLDKARKVAKRGDFEEITLIMPLLKSAYEMLSQVKKSDRDIRLMLICEIGQIMI